MSNELNAALILMLDAVARQCPTRKIFSKYFCYIQTMIDNLIINFTEYFQRKISDPMVRIFTLNQRVQSSILFSNSFFFMKKMN
jgi:hypothetical protein